MNRGMLRGNEGNDHLVDPWWCEFCGAANIGLRCSQCGASLPKEIEEEVEERFSSPYWYSGGVSIRGGIW